MKSFKFFLNLVTEHKVYEYLSNSIINHYKELVSKGMKTETAVLNTANYFETTPEDVKAAIEDTIIA